jgi:hypothetical protein
MTTIHELKEAILEMEKVAHEWEQQADEAWAQADADFCEKIAGMYRIAAACCWEPGTAGPARRRESFRRMRER